jgi:trimeric autotransporter adhesin
MSKKQIRFIGLRLAMGLMVVLTLIMMACSSTTKSTSISTSTSTARLNVINISTVNAGKVTVGATQQFTAMGNYTNNTSADITSKVTWDSTKTDVATINADGLATAVGPGFTFITASMSGVSSRPIQIDVISP